MSTRKLSDKEFDRYAKNLLKKPEGVSFDKAAWAAMEQQLGQTGTTSSIFNLKWLIPAIALILSSVLYLILKEPVSTNTQVELEQRDLIEADRPAFDESGVIVDKNDSITSETIAVASLGINNPNYADIATPVIKKQEAFDETGLDSKNINSEESSLSTNDQEKYSQPKESGSAEEGISGDQLKTESRLDRKNDAALVKESEKTIETNEGSELPIRESEGIVESSDQPDKTNETVNYYNVEPKSVIVVLAPTEESELNLTMVEIAGEEKAIEENDLTVDESSTSEEEVATFHRWSVGITLAPDFSTVGQLNEFTQPGIDAGLSVEFFITKRLSVTSGAILTRKLYNTTDIGEYTIPAGFWNGAGAPEEIIADCRVIDIPINFRYRLVEGKRTSLFASVGMSSYLMLNEQYDYSYADGQYNGSQPTGWEVSNENNHFFGVYNLSAGITRRIGRYIYIEAEPFLKNSLGGVGWGQVRLKSTGVLFHLKYNF